MLEFRAELLAEFVVYVSSTFLYLLEPDSKALDPSFFSPEVFQKKYKRLLNVQRISSGKDTLAEDRNFFSKVGQFALEIQGISGAGSATKEFIWAP